MEKLLTFMQLVNSKSLLEFFLEIQFLLFSDKVIFLYQLFDGGTMLFQHHCSKF